MNNRHLVLSLFLGMILSLGTFSTVQAQNCNSAARVTSDLFQEVLAKAEEKGCGKKSKSLKIRCVVAKGVSFTSEMIQYWNIMAGNTWASIGPRKLVLNSRENGNIVGTSGRMYISPYPMSSNSATVTINELDGKGKLAFIVCLTDVDGNTQRVGERWFNDSNKRKNKRDESRTINIPNAKDKIVTVHMDGKSVANSFRYNIVLN